MFESGLLKGKSIIITGGGTGLGKSMATRFAELGADLVITKSAPNSANRVAMDFPNPVPPPVTIIDFPFNNPDSNMD